MEQPQAAPEVSNTTLLARSMLAESDSDNPPAETAQEPVETSTAEPEQDNAEATATEPQGQPEPDLHEVEFEGEVLRVPVKIKDALMKDADYRQKTAALAEDRRATEASRQQLGQLMQHAQLIVQQSQQLAPVFGQVSALDSQIAQLQQQMTPQFEQNDPVGFSNLGTRLFLLSQQRNNIFATAQAQMAEHQARYAQVNAQANQERQAQAVAAVKKAIPQYNEQVSKDVGEYVAKSGLPREALVFMDSSAPAFLLAWKAKEYDRIQAETKVSLRKVVDKPPVAKPSARGQSSESKTRMDKLREQYRATGGKDSNLAQAILREKLGMKE